jgi:uncharacterized delta-60 repeat protein
MGISGGPNITKNGLALILDAADKNSYSGSGTTWYDLSGNINTSTLNNGPTFITASGGMIVTDGTNDNISISSTQTIGLERGLHWDTEWTLEMWFNPNTWGGPQGYKYIYANYNGAAAPTYPSMPYLILNSVVGSPSITFGPSIESNTVTTAAPWLSSITSSMNHIVFTFSSASGFFRTYLNGSSRESGSFNFSTNFGTNNCVEVIKVDSSNKVWVGGTFQKYNNTPISYGIARLTESGSFDTTWITGSTSSPRLSGFNHKVQDIEFTGSEAHITGMYRYYKNVINYCGVRVNYTGSKTGFDPAFNYGIQSIKTNSSGKSYVCIGNSTFMGASNARFHRLNSNGAFDSTFVTGSGFNGNSFVVRLDSNEKPIVGGAFTSYSGSTTQYIARLNIDGTLDTNFNATSGFNNWVYTIAIDSNGKIYVGGVFTTYKGVAANRIIRLNTDGTKDTGFDNSTGFNGTVTYIEIAPDGKIMVAGDFTTYKGSSYSKIIRLNTDGTIDTSFNPGSGFDKYTTTIAFESGSSKMYVGGRFFSYSGSFINGIVKLNSSGSIDTTFNSGTGFSRANDRPAETSPLIGGDAIGFVNLSLGTIKIYNRALSSSEIQQNYNAQKSRFNL